MTDVSQKWQEALKGLHTLAETQGYLLRSATVDTLRPLSADADQIADTLEMFADIGIPVVEAAPTPAELTAIHAAPRNQAVYLDNAPKPVGVAIDLPVVAFRVGAEGGDIRLIGQNMTSHWRYRYTMLDHLASWLEDVGPSRRQSPWVYDWNAALQAVDKYPWAMLCPIEVNPQFADRVLEAVQERLSGKDRSSRAAYRLSEWTALCRG